VVIVSAFALIVRSPMLRVFRPEGNQAPSHKHDLALTRVAVETNDRLKRLRRYIPARPKVGQRRTVNGEVLGDLLLVRSANVAATHEGMLSRKLGVANSDHFKRGLVNRWESMKAINIPAAKVQRSHECTILTRKLLPV
jgi:hypothetical protein